MTFVTAGLEYWDLLPESGDHDCLTPSNLLCSSVGKIDFGGLASRAAVTLITLRSARKYGIYFFFSLLLTVSLDS